MLSTIARALRTPLKFATVGIANTAIDFAVFSLLFAVIGFHILLAHGIAFMTAVSNSYLMNRLWTFREHEMRRREQATLILYVLVSIGGLAVSSFVLVMLDTIIHWILAKIGAIGATFAWNYLLTSRLLFKSSLPKKGQNQ